MNGFTYKCTFCNCHVDQDRDTLLFNPDQTKISLFMDLLSTCSSFINYNYQFNSLPLCTKCEIMLTNLSELHSELERIKQELSITVSSLSMNIIKSVAEHHQQLQQEEVHETMDSYLTNDIIIQEFRNAVYSSFSPRVNVTECTRKKRKRKKPSSSHHQNQKIIKIVDFSKILENPYETTYANYNMNTNINMNENISVMNLEPDMTYFLQHQNQNQLPRSSNVSIPGGTRTRITSDITMVQQQEFINENTDVDDEMIVMNPSLHEIEDSSSAAMNTSGIYQCTTCFAEFTRYRDFNRHLRSHQDPFPYKCPLENCTHQFKTQGALVRHAQTHEVPTIRCEECGLGYGTAQALKSHQIKIHRGKELFPCHICQVPFTRRADCLRHVRFAHWKHPRDHKCYYCGLVFNSTTALQPHLTTHNGPPIYLCAMPGCKAAGICLISPDDYRAHMENYHSPGLNLNNTK